MAIHRWRSQFPRRRHGYLSAVLLIISSVLAGCQPASSATVPGIQRSTLARQPDPGGPVLRYNRSTIRKITSVDPGYLKLARHPITGDVYALHPVKGIARVDLSLPGSMIPLATADQIVADAEPAGMAFGPDGTLFVSANRKVDQTRTQAVIRKGTARAADEWQWDALATTEPYPIGNTPFDHRINGLVVSADGTWLYINSGSRTDHGEVESNNGAFPGTREVGLTAKILRVPTDARDLTLPNDEAALSAQGFVFARGTRNAFDLEIAPNGDLFAVDNGPDADYPDELNWIREGQHYGFPWRFGDQPNPQQFANYDATRDRRLSPDFTAVQIGAYANDPDFPQPTDTFTDPISNRGPDAAQFRADDGQQRDAAAEGKPLLSFTPHRSPLGLVFATDAKLPADLRSDEGSLGAFVLSWGAAGGTLSDKGQDLLHLRLTKQGTNYSMISTQIAYGFKNPIDAVMIENRLYVLEFGAGSALWQITFE